jgi:hypothetical protein
MKINSQQREICQILEYDWKKKHGLKKTREWELERPRRLVPSPPPPKGELEDPEYIIRSCCKLKIEMQESV